MDNSDTAVKVAAAKTGYDAGQFQACKDRLYEMHIPNPLSGERAETLEIYLAKLENEALYIPPNRELKGKYKKILDSRWVDLATAKQLYGNPEFSAIMDEAVKTIEQLASTKISNWFRSWFGRGN